MFFDTSDLWVCDASAEGYFVRKECDVSLRVRLVSPASPTFVCTQLEHADGQRKWRGQGRIQRLVMALIGVNFGRTFLQNNTKLCTHKTPKTEQIFTKLAQNLRFFEKIPTTGKIAYFLCASCKRLQLCKFLLKENFAISSLKYGHRAIQNGGRGADGELAPPSPPRSATARRDTPVWKKDV